MAPINLLTPERLHLFDQWLGRNLDDFKDELELVMGDERSLPYPLNPEGQSVPTYRDTYIRSWARKFHEHITGAVRSPIYDLEELLNDPEVVKDLAKPTGERWDRGLRLQDPIIQTGLDLKALHKYPPIRKMIGRTLIYGADGYEYNLFGFRVAPITRYIFNRLRMDPPESNYLILYTGFSLYGTGSSQENDDTIFNAVWGLNLKSAIELNFPDMGPVRRGRAEFGLTWEPKEELEYKRFIFKSEVMPLLEELRRDKVQVAFTYGITPGFVSGYKPVEVLTQSV